MAQTSVNARFLRRILSTGDSGGEPLMCSVAVDPAQIHCWQIAVVGFPLSANKAVNRSGPSIDTCGTPIDNAKLSTLLHGYILPVTDVL